MKALANKDEKNGFDSITYEDELKELVSIVLNIGA